MNDIKEHINITHESESEDEICRFCHYDGKENKLYQPCKCSGSIKNIHLDCLTRWIKATGKDKCDLCKHSFSFTPIYAENTPESLTPKELMEALFSKVSQAIKSFLNNYIIFALWIYLLPLSTSRIWYFMFHGNFIQENSKISQYIFFDKDNELSIVIDVFVGIILILSSLLIFFSFSFFFKKIKKYSQEGDFKVQDINGNVIQKNEVIFGIVIRDNGIDFVRNVKEFFFSVFKSDTNQQVERENLNEDDIEEAVDCDFLHFSGVKSGIIEAVWRASHILWFNTFFYALFVFVPYVLGVFFYRMVRSSLNYYYMGLIDSLYFHYGKQLLSNFRVAISLKEFHDLFHIFLGMTILFSLAVLYIFYFCYFSNERKVHVQSGMRITLLRFIYLSWVSIKVIAFLSIELFLAPFFSGILMDFFTLSFFNSSFDDRLQLCIKQFLIMGFFHWFVGIIFNFVVGTFFRWTKAMLNKHVLWFIRDTEDPNFSPIKEIMKKSVFHHIKRVSLSLSLYFYICFIIFYMSSRFTSIFYPKLVPLNVFSNFEIVYQVPIDIFLVHLLIPNISPIFRPYNAYKALLINWVHLVGNLLGLSEYLISKDKMKTLVEPQTNANLNNNNNHENLPNENNDNAPVPIEENVQEPNLVIENHLPVIERKSTDSSLDSLVLSTDKKEDVGQRSVEQDDEKQDVNELEESKDFTTSSFLSFSSENVPYTFEKLLTHEEQQQTDANNNNNYDNNNDNFNNNNNNNFNNNNNININNNNENNHNHVNTIHTNNTQNNNTNINNTNNNNNNENNNKDAELIIEDNGKNKADSSFFPKPRFFGLRIFALICLVSFTFLFGFLLSFSLPICLGRNTIYLLSGGEYTVAEIYTFQIGISELFSIVWLLHFLDKKMDLSQMLNETKIYFQAFQKFFTFIPKMLQLFLITVFWGFFVPMVVGILYERAVLIPIRIFFSYESPAYFFSQDWAIGLLILKLWFQVSRVIDLPVFSNPTAKRLSEEIERQGFFKSLTWENTCVIIFKLAVPLIFNILLIILIPFIFFRGVLPFFISDDESSYALIEHLWNFFYLFLFFLFSLVKLFVLLHSMVNSFHTQLRDEKYRIGVELNNFISENSSSTSENSSSPPSLVDGTQRVVDSVHTTGDISNDILDTN